MNALVAACHPQNEAEPPVHVPPTKKKCKTANTAADKVSSAITMAAAALDHLSSAGAPSSSNMLAQTELSIQNACQAHIDLVNASKRKIEL